MVIVWSDYGYYIWFFFSEPLSFWLSKLSYCCYIISTLEESETENELPGKHVNETVINMEPPNPINEVSQTVGPGSPAIPLPYILSNHLGLN